MRIVVIGKSGLMARALAAADPAVVALGRDDLDIWDAAAVRAALAGADVVINAAAYTAVDRAETDQAAAYALNRDAPALLARVCAEAAIPLLQLSTDYVFDGTKGAPYAEEDARAPLNVYGASKAAGEDAVLASGARALVLRGSWLFAAAGANFVSTMLRLAQTRDAVDVVGDQLGRPSYAADVAGACVTLARALRDGAAGGVLHVANTGEARWADVAEAVFDAARARGWPAAKVRRVTSAEYGAAAQRPADSRLDVRTIARTHGVALRDWREALADCFARMS